MHLPVEVIDVEKPDWLDVLEDIHPIHTTLNNEIIHHMTASIGKIRDVEHAARVDN